MGTTLHVDRVPIPNWTTIFHVKFNLFPGNMLHWCFSLSIRDLENYFYPRNMYLGYKQCAMNLFRMYSKLETGNSTKWVSV